MSFLKEVATLFTGMTVPAIICLILGIILIFVEIFQPGFGIFGTLGGILSVAGIVLRVLVGDGNIFAQIFLLILFDMILIMIAVLIMVFATKKGWLSRSPFIQKKTAVNIDYSEGTSNYKELVGSFGSAVTDLHPTGKGNFNGIVYDIIADGFYIKKGEGIKVIAVEGVKIIVCPLEINK